MEEFLNKKISELTVGELLTVFNENNLRLISITNDKHMIIEEISHLLYALGILPKLNGYNYIRSSILLAIEDRKILSLITKILYPKLAKQYNTTPLGIEHAIQYAIKVSFSRGDKKTITEIFGNKVNYENGKLTNSVFLAMITDYVISKII